MAKTQLTKNTTTGNWELTETNQSQNYTNTLLTAGLPIEGDIKIDITAKSGTAGTPTATKGTVSSNSITVTPSVTNTEGYISGGTKTGTGVTVNASELVSGNKQLTQATSTDVTNYATATVRSATASMPSSLSGTSATASLSGTTLILTKNLTNTATVTTAGWLSSLTGTTSVSLSGTVPTETKTASGAGDISPSTGKLLSKVTVPSGSGSVDNSTITPTFSRTGNVITVTGSTTTTGTIDTAGWISSITSGTSSISSTNNVNKYTIPSASSFSLSITDKASTNLTVGTLSSGYYPFTTSLTGTLSASTGGYFTSGSATDSSVTVGRLPAAVPSASVSSYIAPNVEVSGSATGFTPSSSETSYYVSVNGNPTNGSVKAKYTNSTAGYAPKNTTGTESSATTITPTVTGDGNKIYIPSGSATTPTNTTALSSTSTSLSNTTLTVQANVTPTVVEGYTTTGTAGTVKISGTVPTDPTITVTPSTETQTITPTSGKLLSNVTVNAVPAFDFDTQSSQVYYPNHPYCPFDANNFTIKSLMITTSYSGWPSSSKIQFSTLDEPRYFIPLGYQEMNPGNSGAPQGNNFSWSSPNIIIKVVLTYQSGTSGRKLTVYSRGAGATSWTQRSGYGTSSTDPLYLWVRNYNSSYTRSAQNVLIEVYPPSGLK